MKGKDISLNFIYNLKKKAIVIIFNAFLTVFTTYERETAFRNVDNK